MTAAASISESHVITGPTNKNTNGVAIRTVKNGANINFKTSGRTFRKKVSSFAAIYYDNIAGLSVCVLLTISIGIPKKVCVVCSV